MTNAVKSHNKYMEVAKHKIETGKTRERPHFSTDLLQALEPTLKLFRESPYFKGIERTYARMADSFFAIPRSSGQEDEINDHLKEQAETTGWYAEIDSHKNIGIVVAATSGYENVSPLLVHFHTDMVPTAGFTDPIEPEVVVLDGQQWIKAKEARTLGADDGAGAAALIQSVQDFTEERDENNQLKPHGPILLFGTSREEKGLEGMDEFVKDNTFNPEEAFAKLLPKVQRILNSDGEEADRLTIGALGGEIFNIKLPVEREAIPQGYTCVRVSLKGFRGGHSGKYAWNPSPLGALSGMLADLDGVEYRIGTIQTTNIADNAIPQDASMLLAVSNTERGEFFSRLVEKQTVDLQTKYPEDKVSIAFEIPADKPEQVLTADSSHKTAELLSGLSGLQGVASASDVFGDTVLERSFNNGIIAFDDSSVSFTPFSRVRGDNQYGQYTDALQKITNKVGAELTQTHTLPFWEPDLTRQKEYEKLLHMYKDTFGKEAHLEFAPGGMEMSIFDQVYPDVLKVSNGVTIIDAHIPGERMEAKTLAELYIWNRKILGQWRDELLSEPAIETSRRTQTT